MVSAPQPAAPARTPAFRVAFRYALDGDLRFLSHRDELRMLRRALVRADWPLRFSHGYNPMPWISVPLPRRVGLASDCQLALTELSEPRLPAELWDSLAAALPEACQLRTLDAPAPPGTPHPLAAEFAVTLSPAARETIASAVQTRQAILQHSGAAPQGDLDAPSETKCQLYLERVAWDGSELRLRLRFVEQRTARPSEVLTEFGLAPDSGEYAVRLSEVAWNVEFSGPDSPPRASKGIAIGYQENSKQSHEEQNHY